MSDTLSLLHKNLPQWSIAVFPLFPTALHIKKPRLNGNLAVLYEVGKHLCALRLHVLIRLVERLFRLFCTRKLHRSLEVT